MWWWRMWLGQGVAGPGGQGWRLNEPLLVQQRELDTVPPPQRLAELCVHVCELRRNDVKPRGEVVLKLLVRGLGHGVA